MDKVAQRMSAGLFTFRLCPFYFLTIRQTLASGEPAIVHQMFGPK